MSDRPFLDKMDMPGGFKESALRLNKYVVLQNEWNEKNIQERANELAKKAEAIWPYPTLTAAELAPYQTEEKTVQKYSLESYDVNAFTRMLFESLDKRIMNLSPAVKKEYKSCMLLISWILILLILSSRNKDYVFRLIMKFSRD